MREDLESGMGGRGRLPGARAVLVAALALGLAGCETYEEVITFLLPDLVALPAGAFEQPAAALTGQARARFLAGHKACQAACGACHPGDERAPPPVAEGALAETAILRLIPPDPRYGAARQHYLQFWSPGAYRPRTAAFYGRLSERCVVLAQVQREGILRAMPER